MNKNPKYKVGDHVVIDKMFGTNINAAGSMEKLERERIAEVVEVSLTSTGTSYKLRSIGKPELKFIAFFWEEDILGHFDI